MSDDHPYQEGFSGACFSGACAVCGFNWATHPRPAAAGAKGEAMTQSEVESLEQIAERVVCDHFVGCIPPDANSDVRGGRCYCNRDGRRALILDALAAVQVEARDGWIEEARVQSERAEKAEAKQHCDCGAKAIREAESLREQLAGVTATCEGHKLEQTRRRELAEAERDAAIKERDALKLAVQPARTCWVENCQKPYGHDGACEPTPCKATKTEGGKVYVCLSKHEHSQDYHFYRWNGLLTAMRAVGHALLRKPEPGDDSRG